MDSGLDRGLQWALEHELDEYLETGLRPGERPTPIVVGRRLPWQHQIGQPIDRPGAEEPIFGGLVNLIRVLSGRLPPNSIHLPWRLAAAAPEAGAPHVPSPPIDRRQADIELAAAGMRHRIDPQDMERWRFRENLTGIVMVHGIGPQLAGQTLLDWTTPIITLLRDAVAADAGRKFRKEPALAPPSRSLHDIDDPVFRANIDFSGETFPVVQVRIPWRAKDLEKAKADYERAMEAWEARTIDKEPRPPEDPRWIFTETWWASEVRPPTLRMMVAWLGEQGGVGRIVQGIQQNTFGSGPLHHLARISVLPFVSVIASFALILLIVGLAISRFIPIASIREAVTLRLASAFLTDWFGGARTLLRDPAQSANVRSRLVMTVKALRAYGCRRIVIVAHSGGTIVTLSTLTDPAFPNLEVDKLITIGEALNLGWRLEAVDPDAEHPVPPKGNRMLGDLGAKRRLLWRDFFGTHDPAASGPPDPPVDSMKGTDRFTTERIYNRMSVLGDHGAYWNNDEHFLIPLIREIDVPNGNRRKSRFYRDAVESFVRARRKERLSFLRLWRRGTSTLPIMAIVAAALVTAHGMIPLIGSAALAVLESVPFSKELGQLGAKLSSLGTFETDGILPFDVIYGIGIGVLLGGLAFLVLQALIPSGARGLWRQRKWWQRTALLVDISLGPVPFALILVGWWATVGATGGLDAVRNFVVDASLPGTVVFVGAVVFFATIGTKLRAKLRTSSSTPLRIIAIAFSALFLAALLVALAGASLGVILVYTGSASRPDSEATRTFVVGAVVVLGLFRLLQRVGEWRWDAWDIRERQQLRREPLKCPGRGWSIVIASMLSAIAIAAAIAVAIGTPATFSGSVTREMAFWGLIAATIVLSAITIAKDVVDNDVDGAGRLVGSSGPGVVQPKPTGPGQGSP